MRKLAVLAAAIWTSLALAAAQALASVAIPLALDDLVSQSKGIVVGTVTAIESHWDARRAAIDTTIEIAVSDILKGGPAVPTVTLKQSGGTVGGVHAWVNGSPEFALGERVLVFLSTNADGSLRVLQLAQGKLSIVADDFTGEEFAFQDPAPAGLSLHSAPGGPPATLAVARRLEDLRQDIRRQAWRRPAGKAVLDAPPMVTAAATEAAPEFSFFNPPGRWFLPDLNQAVPFKMNSQGQPGAPTGGLEQFRAALGAWSAVAGSSLRLADGGFTTADTRSWDGVNAVIFGDRAGEMDEPTNCSGVLAMGGYYRNPYETKTVNGTTFYRIIDGDISIADGWAGCNFYEDFENFAEVITHELGHAIGFGHSGDPAATMYYRAHFDNRGAFLGADDVAAVLYSYPASLTAEQVTLTVSVVGTGTVTSIPAGINCPGQCSASYNKGTYVNLYPAGGPLAAWSGACTGAGDCQIQMTGNRTVTATFGAADLIVTALSASAATVAPGARLSVTDTTANAGGAGAASSRTRYYLASGTVKDQTSVLLSGTRSVSSLAGGAAATGTVTVTVPPAAPLASLYLLACADDLSAVPEANEANNCRPTASRLAVTLPDLVVASLTPSAATVPAGGRLRVSETTRNQGLVRANSSTTRYYLSLDGTRGAGDRLLSGNHSVPALDPAASHTATPSLAVPSATPPNMYYLLACADDYARVNEVGGDNNCRAAAALVRVTAP